MKQWASKTISSFPTLGLYGKIGYHVHNATINDQNIFSYNFASHLTENYYFQKINNQN